MENSETIEEEKLMEVAKALEVSVEAIKIFLEEGVFNYFNNFYDNSQGANFGSNSTCNFNPLDKLMESVDENKDFTKDYCKQRKTKLNICYFLPLPISKQIP